MVNMREKRLQRVIDFVNTHKVASVTELCDEFDVSEATIRRDIDELSKKTLIHKVHGGAKSIVNETKTELPYVKRMIMNVEEKKRISEYCLSLISDADIIILDSSTTTTELAKLLANVDLNIVVLTNDTNIAGILSHNPSIELIMIGGMMRKGFFTTLGLYAEDMWRKFHANKLFLGVDSVSPDLGIMGYQTEEILIKKIMIEQSAQCIVLADHTKFSTIALTTICPITSVDKIITGKEVDELLLVNYNENDKQKIIRV